MKIIRSLVILSALLFSFIATAQETVDINTATIEELVKIIHIGQARATELISLRPFYSLDDLERIKGISEARIEAIKNQGIAWIDPNLVKPEPIKENTTLISKEEIEPTQSNIQENVIKEDLYPPEPILNDSSPLPLYLGAGFTSVFSGAIILLLKKNIKRI